VEKSQEPNRWPIELAIHMHSDLEIKT